MSHNRSQSSLTPSPSTNPPRAPRRERRKAETYERLMRAALRLFAEQGLAATTIEQITESADVGKGTFFNYFPTKEHVLLAFGDTRIKKIRAALEEAREGSQPMWQILRRLARSLAEEASNTPGLLRSILVAPLSREPVREFMAGKLKEGREALAELFQIGQDRAEVRSDLSPAYMARGFQQSVFGALVLWSLDPQGDLIAWLDVWLEMFLGGLDPPSPRAIRGARGRA
ncbi:MAG TPA: TetR/AcrR family transcriptional regulator [Candidatus Acidoferrales bacterium]|nr:TetR/AcrR family transcriptional regulator [Candidatus Acidoferrales bacterium]